jgi:hypothetical protein
MTAYFIVRAQVADPALRGDFDRWYRDEHLPDAKQSFGARRAFRAWSQTEPAVHYAFYEFADAASAHALSTLADFKRLVAEFDRVWGNRVTRSRDVVEVAQTIGEK